MFRIFLNLRRKLYRIGQLLSILALVIIFISFSSTNVDHDCSLKRKTLTGVQADETSRGSAKVIIVAHGRGGSSFVGELFNQNDDACYWFEPVSDIVKVTYGQLGKTSSDFERFYPNGTKRILSQAEHRYLEKYMLHILNDRSGENIPAEIMFSPLFSQARNRWTRNFHKCVRRRIKTRVTLATKQRRCPACLPEPPREKAALCHTNQVLNKLESTKRLSTLPWPKTDTCKNLTCHHLCMEKILDDTKTCFKHFENNCGRKPVVGVKTIRLTLNDAAKIQKRDPSVTLLYYVRDPRGIHFSRGKVWERKQKKNRKQWLANINNICDRMREDIETLENLKQVSPCGVLTVKYEDFVQEPIKYAKHIYNHIGLNAPETVLNWVQNATSSKRNSGYYGTTRVNATRTSLAWTEKFSHSDISTMNGYCQDVLNYFRYDLMPK